MTGLRELKKIIAEQSRYANECAERGDNVGVRYHLGRVEVRRLEYFRKAGVWPETCSAERVRKVMDSWLAGDLAEQGAM